MSLTFDDVRKILRIVDQTSTTEVRLEYQDLKLVIRKGGSAGLGEDTSSEDANVTAKPAETTEPLPPGTDAIALRAPLGGTFYAAPSPGEPAFVKEGDYVTLEQTLCIIDVMKVMNNISAPVAGVVKRIDAVNAQAIMPGQALMWIEPQDCE